MTKYLPVSVLLVTCNLLLVTVQAQDRDNHLERFLRDLETYSAGFDQVQYNGSGDEVERAVGVVYLRRPGMFHWAYYEPYNQEIISDGISLWIYEQDLEQVIVKDVEDTIGDSPAAVLGGNVKVEDHYVIVDLDTAEGIDWLELTPRDLDSQYTTVRLGFTGDQLVRMVLFDNLGYRTLITFLDTRRNPDLNLDLFRFDAPEGTDIIDNRR